MLQLNDPICLEANVGVVGYKEKHMTGFMETMEDFHDYLFVFGIEVASGFVSQDDFRLVDQEWGSGVMFAIHGSA